MRVFKWMGRSNPAETYDTLGVKFKGKIILSTGAYLLTGSAATRTAVRADGGDAAPVGSVYFSTDGGATTAPKVYFKIANATADADWERLVTAAAD